MDAQTKKRQTAVSPAQTQQRIVVPPEVPHDTRISIEDIEDMEIDQLREKRETREVQGVSLDIRHAEHVLRERGPTASVSNWNAQTRTRMPGFKLSGIASHRKEETLQNQSLEEN